MTEYTDKALSDFVVVVVVIIVVVIDINWLPQKIIDMNTDNFKISHYEPKTLVLRLSGISGWC